MTKQAYPEKTNALADRYTGGPVFVMVATAFDADDWQPRIVGEDDLRRFVDGAIRAGEGNNAPFASVRLFWFTASGEPIECAVEFDARQSIKYNDDDYATSVYHVMTPRGTALATFQVSVDGRA